MSAVSWNPFMHPNLSAPSRYEPNAHPAHPSSPMPHLRTHSPMLAHPRAILHADTTCSGLIGL